MSSPIDALCKEAAKLKLEGNDLFKAKEYKAAASKYRQAIDKDQCNVVYYTNLCACLNQLKLYEEMNTAASKCITIDENSVKGHYWLIMSLKKQKKYKEAFVQCDSSLEKFPENSDIKLLQAEIGMKVKLCANEKCPVPFTCQEALFKCSACKDKDIFYCSRDCQKSDWSRHRYTCNSTPATQPIIVEMHNVAEFLSVVNNILGHPGPKTLQGLVFETDVISSKSGYIDNTIKTKNINHVRWAKIGEKGVPVTVDDVIAMLQLWHTKVPKTKNENEYYPYFINLLKAVKGFVGKDGPCYLEHGIVTASNVDVKLDVLRKMQGSMRLVEPGQLGFAEEDTSGEMSTMPIGEQGRKVTLDDIIDTFRKVSTHERLEKFRHSGRSYFLEGFKVVGGGKTLSVTWGS